MTSDLGLHCLPLSHKKDAKLILVNTTQHQLIAQFLVCIFVSSNCDGGTEEQTHPFCEIVNFEEHKKSESV